LDPLTFMFWVSMAELLQRGPEARADHRSCASSSERGSEPFPTTLRVLASSYARLGRFDEARATAKQVLALTPDFTVAKWLQMTAKLPQYRPYFAESLRLAGFPE
jgi:hypothetical protein